MQRNSGSIGAKRDTTASSATGVHDTFDAYNSRRNSIWPRSLTISISPSTTNVTEGNSVVFTITDTNGSTGTITLYWTITTAGGASAADFSQGASGSFSLTNSSGTVTLTPVANDGTENETFTLQVRRDSTSGEVLATSATITITDATISELYSFTNVTFGAGASANTGPSLAQVQAAMSGTPTPSNWNTNSSYLSVTNGIILWTVPATATYRITANGASGNPASTSNRGATIRGDFSLTQGEKLRILVGQSPIGTGGGGGSYVVKETGSTNSDIYVIAGGGGGKSGGAGGTATPANSSNTVSNGNGGLAQNSSWNGPAGGGFFTNGTVASSTPRGNVGIAFLNGGNGGAATGGGTGGFGGGGSGGADSAAGGGAGGGYSGGSGGPDGSSGQGAGSYPNGSNQSNTANNNSGAGSVVIVKL